MRWEASDRTALCFVGCCFRNSFNAKHGIFVSFPSGLFSMRFVSVHVVYPYNSMDKATGLKKTFLFYQIDKISIWSITFSIVVHAFTRHVLRLLSVDDIFLPRYVKIDWLTYKNIYRKFLMTFYSMIRSLVVLLKHLDT